MAKFVNWFKNEESVEMVNIDTYNERLTEISEKFRLKDFGTRALRLVKGNNTYSIYNCREYVEIRY
jgi:hypothetical protein